MYEEVKSTIDQDKRGDDISGRGDTTGRDLGITMNES